LRTEDPLRFVDYQELTGRIAEGNAFSNRMTLETRELLKFGLLTFALVAVWFVLASASKSIIVEIAPGWVKTLALPHHYHVAEERVYVRT